MTRVLELDALRRIILFCLGSQACYTSSNSHGQVLGRCWEGVGLLLIRLNPLKAGRLPKVVHLNTIKQFHKRSECVKRLKVLAEGDSADDVLGNIGDQRKLVGEGTCRGFDRRALDEVLDRYIETLSAVPGRTHMLELFIDTGEAEPVQTHLYRSPEKLVGAIKEELEDLLEKGIIEPSTSEWESPIIPVMKNSVVL